MRAFRFDALQVTPTRAEVREYRRAASAAGVPNKDVTAPPFRSGCTTFVALVFVLVVFALAITGFAIEGLTWATFGVGLVALFFGLGGWVLAAQIRFPRRGSRLWRDRLRLARLAQTNGCIYTPVASGLSGHPGLLPSMGERFSDIVQTPEAPHITIGNLAYQQRTSRGGATNHTWGFITVQLDRRFPHTILDSRTNQGFSGGALPHQYQGGAVQLEGDFARHFWLFCPAGYDSDIRFLLTPDLMADLIDEGSSFDVEIIDDRLLFYKPGGLILGDAQEWRVINRLLARVGAGMRKRSGRYTDDRSLDGVVAPQGARMQKINLLPWIIGTFLVINAVYVIVLLVQ
ncbi:hypothetical protein ACSAGD_00195 [Paramicrobacterium sp. CJ85]|uniref:hypothetical protein n=1 Tax=Paramicrobacterium sp. CJ85 TaxID=3445355 RepID=UPI003F60434A